jgi:hypothetical protein
MNGFNSIGATFAPDKPNPVFVSFRVAISIQLQRLKVVSQRVGEESKQYLMKQIVCF